MAMVRKARCPMCGSAKSTPTKSAYIYCDYCGQLMDLDLALYRKEVPIPSEAYRELDDRLAPKIQSAKKKRDRKLLTELHREIQDRWVTDMAAMFSPRVKDPEFREQLVDYLTYTRVVSDLSVELEAACEKLDAANAGMEMVQRDGRWLVTGKSLWPILVANNEARQVLLKALGSFEDPVRDPDDTPPAVSEQLGQWLYISGWMTMIDDETAQELLQRAGLESGWEHVPDPELRSMFCGHCGAKHERVVGARRVLCESCGKHSDVGHDAQCHSCGARVVIGLGKTAATCASCNAEARLVPQLT